MAKNPFPKRETPFKVEVDRKEQAFNRGIVRQQRQIRESNRARFDTSRDGQKKR